MMAGRIADPVKRVYAIAVVGRPSSSTFCTQISVNAAMLRWFESP
jgi:hypothetical protein